MQKSKQVFWKTATYSYPMVMKRDGLASFEEECLAVAAQSGHSVVVMIPKETSTLPTFEQPAAF